jgi:hypothetical protein
MQMLLVVMQMCNKLNAKKIGANVQ